MDMVVLQREAQLPCTSFKSDRNDDEEALRMMLNMVTKI